MNENSERLNGQELMAKMLNAQTCEVHLSTNQAPFEWYEETWARTAHGDFACISRGIHIGDGISEPWHELPAKRERER